MSAPLKIVNESDNLFSSAGIFLRQNAPRQVRKVNFAVYQQHPISF